MAPRGGVHPRKIQQPSCRQPTKGIPIIATNSLPSCGLTPREAAAYLRIGRDALMAMIRRGELGAVAHRQSGRTRYVILPSHLDTYVNQHQAANPPKSPRKKQTNGIDYFPDL